MAARRRLIIVYNPRSSKYIQVEKEVLSVARKLEGWTLGKYEVKPTNVDDNAKKLSKILMDGDLVVTAGGDGTATIGFNGVILSGKDVKFGVLGYGNFNDAARTFRTRSLDEIINGVESKIYPLEMKVNDEHRRYAACYFTLGLFAESTEIFDQPSTRKSLRTGKKSLFFSVTTLAKWYFKNKKREFLPIFKLNGVLIKKKTTDYLAINGKSVARMMRGGKYWQGESYIGGTARLGSFFRLCWFMAKSILFRVPGREVTRDVLVFDKPATFECQAEGEYFVLENVSKLEISKLKKPIKVMIGK